MTLSRYPAKLEALLRFALRTNFMLKKKSLCVLSCVAGLFTGILFLASPSHAASSIKIIGHRGGVVDAQHPENSAGAAKEAIARGYWMLEIDLDEPKGGGVIVHHMSFLQDFGVAKEPSQMTMSEIKKFTSPIDHSHPLEFSEYAALCKDKIQLMIDTKQPGHPRSFYESIEKTLRQNGLLEQAFFIGTDETREYFKGKARISIGVAELQKRLDAGEDLSKTYFLFDHGLTLDERRVALAGRAAIPVVVSINEFHYAYVHSPDPMAAAHADVERARKLGVQYFQIDSVYDQWLR
jgi:glycerophosphoryl diester phosphodiesterase